LSTHIDFHRMTGPKVTIDHLSHVVLLLPLVRFAGLLEWI